MAFRISADGSNWHTLVSLNNANSPNNVYTDFDFDLRRGSDDGRASRWDPTSRSSSSSTTTFPFNSDGRDV